ncbi:DoxX family protein [Dongia sedimenti]|uniref:DoxX family protein n=1 Tax=Dongia sedimenti TaxID=3064282 RepID=A0ABU0YPS0_9PROT|nr:DoxX family protein [Rhodospirillaceae bacterium R-7]
MSESLRFLPLIGRILIALIFVMSGFGKIQGFQESVAYAASKSLPLPAIGVAIAIAIEFVGGLLLIAGYKTRWVAAAIALFCVVAAVFFHNDFKDTNEWINFMKNLAIAGGLLQIVYFGAGPMSVDNRK